MCRSICRQYVRREGLNSATAVEIISGRDSHGNVEVFGRDWKQPKGSVNPGGGAASLWLPRACECGVTPERLRVLPLFSCRPIMRQFETIINMTLALLRLMHLLSSGRFNFAVGSASTCFVFNLHVVSVSVEALARSRWFPPMSTCRPRLSPPRR